MNNNLTLTDLQNKYRDQRALSKNGANNNVKPEAEVKEILPKENSSTAAKHYDVFSPKTKQVKPRIFKQSPEVKPGKLRPESEAKLRTLSKKRKEVNDGPIMAFLLFSGLAMFVGMILLVANNISGISRPTVLGQTTQQNANKKIVDANNETVVAVQKSIDETNEKKQKEYELEKQKSQENIDDVVPLNSETLNSNEDSESKEAVLEETAKLEMVRIKTNPQGGVNLRLDPNGAMKASALSGEEFELVNERDGWIEIKYSENENYWVLADLVEKIGL